MDFTRDIIDRVFDMLNRSGQATLCCLSISLSIRFTKDCFKLCEHLNILLNIQDFDRQSEFFDTIPGMRSIRQNYCFFIQTGRLSKSVN